MAQISRRQSTLPKDKKTLIPAFRDTIEELRKVVWPTRKHTTNLTVVVVAISVAVGLILGIVDWIFLRLIDVLLGITR